jgi:antitoxin (DNA-binding transcriptional repressor) of toxin-antitoxin stability system
MTPLQVEVHDLPAWFAKLLALAAAGTDVIVTDGNMPRARLLPLEGVAGRVPGQQPRPETDGRLARCAPARRLLDGTGIKGQGGVESMTDADRSSLSGKGQTPRNSVGQAQSEGISPETGHAGPPPAPC